MVAISSLLAVLVLSPAIVHADGPSKPDVLGGAAIKGVAIARDSYQDYVLHLCGDAGDKIEGACADKFKNIQSLLERWNSVCKEPTDPGSPFYEEQAEEAHSKCPVRVSGVTAAISPENWKKMSDAQRHQEIQDLEDFRVGFNRTAQLYHELMTTDGWKAKDLVKQLNKDTVGIVPSFGSKEKAHLSVREAIFVYLGPDGLNKLIGVKDLKGKPQAAESGNNGATSRYGQLDAKDRKLDAQMRASGKKAKDMIKALQKTNPLDANIDDSVAAGYVSDLGSAGRFWTTGQEAQQIAAKQQALLAQQKKVEAKKEQLDSVPPGINDLPQRFPNRNEAAQKYNACGTDIFCAVNVLNSVCASSDRQCQTQLRDEADKLKNPQPAKTEPTLTPQQKLAQDLKGANLSSIKTTDLRADLKQLEGDAEAKDEVAAIQRELNRRARQAYLAKINGMKPDEEKDLSSGPSYQAGGVHVSEKKKKDGMIGSVDWDAGGMQGRLEALGGGGIGSTDKAYTLAGGTVFELISGGRKGRYQVRKGAEVDLEKASLGDAKAVAAALKGKVASAGSGASKGAYWVSYDWGKEKKDPSTRAIVEADWNNGSYLKVWGDGAYLEVRNGQNEYYVKEGTRVEWRRQVDEQRCAIVGKGEAVFSRDGDVAVGGPIIEKSCKDWNTNAQGSSSEASTTPTDSD